MCSFQFEAHPAYLTNLVWPSILRPNPNFFFHLWWLRAKTNLPGKLLASTYEKNKTNLFENIARRTANADELSVRKKRRNRFFSSRGDGTMRTTVSEKKQALPRWGLATPTRQWRIKMWSDLFGLVPILSSRRRKSTTVYDCFFLRRMQIHPDDIVYFVATLTA